MGFKTEEEAGRVREWFEGSFFGGGKVRVDFVDDEVRQHSPSILF